MIKFVDNLYNQFENICSNIPEHFKEFPISTAFLLFLGCVLILNIARKILISSEKRKGILDQSCIFLDTSNNKQDCKNSTYRKRFKKRGSCEKCWGKSYNMTDEEAENLIAKGVIWKRIVLLVANESKSMLPYLSFLYTLIVAILSTK